MLERVALHQTRLNLPGLTLDARGVVIGTHALVVASSLDRLVALLAALSDDGLLATLSDGMMVLELAPAKGARAWALRCPCDAVDVADRLRRVGALVLAHTFVGGGRHYVEHRDGSSPYGFDAPATEDPGSGLALYHRSYRHACAVAREIPPSRVVLALSPRPCGPGAGATSPERWILAEEGPGRALVGYLARSGVDAKVGEVTGAAPLSGEPTRKLLFVAPSWPARLRSLARATPGLTAFVPVARGAAVEEGFTHPVALDALAAFAGPALTLFRGRGEPPVRIDDGLPTVSVSSLVRFTATEASPVRLSSSPSALGATALQLHVVPSERAAPGATATWVPAAELELLRRMLYVLGRSALEETTLALTSEGALVRSRGPSALPIGVPLRALGDAVLVPVGFDVTPSTSPRALAAALEVAPGDVVLMRPEGAALFPRDAFVAADVALVAGPTWAPLTSMRVDPASVALTEVTLVNDDVGLRPLRDLP